MGGALSERIIPRRELEILISKVPENPNPKVKLEQYTIPPEVASRMLYIACYVYRDIVGKRVLDLGCGTGRLAIGAAYLGAAEVVGIDIDREVVKIAKDAANGLEVGESIYWVTGDLYALRGRYDTVIQNPPFGVQRRRADRIFLKRALELGFKVYSLHKSEVHDREVVKSFRGSRDKMVPAKPSRFLETYIRGLGGEIEGVYAMLMRIPRVFHFHRKFRHEFIVNLYVIRRKDASKSLLDSHPTEEIG